MYHISSGFSSTNVIYSFRIWEDFAALLNLLQVANPNLPEKIGKSKSWENVGNS